jgi:hypothetical protein
MTQKSDSKEIEPLTIRLEGESARRARFVSEMTGIAPQKLVSEWILADLLKQTENPHDGYLRDLAESTVYTDPAEAAGVEQKIRAWEKSKIGHEFGPLKFATA